MKKSYLTYVTLFVVFLMGATVFGQSKLAENRNAVATAQYVYYVDVKGVDSKAICLDLENYVAHKEGVLSFKTVGFPSNYFVLKATQLLDETAVRKWLQDKNVTLTYFGKGADALEALYLNKKK